MNSHLVIRWLITLAPTPTSATFVPKSRPDAESRNIVYGTPQGRSGRVASSTPMPGTMTTSCRRTQDAVRNASTALPRALSALAPAPPARSWYFWYHSNGIVSMPYLARTCSQPMHMASTTASGWLVLMWPSTDSRDASLPMLPEPRSPNRPTRGAAFIVSSPFAGHRPGAQAADVQAASLRPEGAVGGSGWR